MKARAKVLMYFENRRVRVGQEFEVSKEKFNPKTMEAVSVFSPSKDEEAPEVKKPGKAKKPADDKGEAHN